MTRALIADSDMPEEGPRAAGWTRSASAWARTRDASTGSTRASRSPASRIRAPGARPSWASWRRRPTRKRVVVVGGGVGGLETARVAALRGHQVVLFENGRELGGQVLVAARTPARADYAGIARFLVRQVERQGVDVRLSTEADVDSGPGRAPDVVVVATGSHPFVPALPGLDGKHVVTDRDVLLGPRRGRGARGRGGRRPHPAGALYRRPPPRARPPRRGGLPPLRPGTGRRDHVDRAALHAALLAQGVVFTPHTDLVAVEGSTVVVANVYTGEERRIESVDTVVLSMGARSTDALYRALRGRVAALHAVGDCVAPRGVHHAILEGTRVARLL